MATCYDIPDYINDKFLHKALEKVHNNCKIVVKKMDVKLSDANGENFCSAIYRVLVQYEVNGEFNEKFFVLKDMDMEVAALGSSEYNMYHKVLPYMENIPDIGNIKFSARCYAQERSTNEYYLLDDLTVAGYKCGDRKTGLDFEHAKLLLTKLGQFHACSRAYIESHLATVENDLCAPHFAAGASDPIAQSITYGGMEHAIKVASNWPDFNGIVERMRSNMQRFDERVKELVDPRKKAPIQVIVHGDLWVNNFLYCHDRDGHAQDVLLVDYQNCFLGSPGYDLNYFIYTSVRLDVIKMELEELLRCYYVAFSGISRACKLSNIPTWEDVVREFDRMAFIGYYVAVCELPLCCMSTEVSTNFTADTFVDTTLMMAKRKQMYEGNERVISTLRYILPYFDAKGVLDMVVNQQ